MSRCGGCGFANPDGFRFCGQCGHRLDSAAPPRDELRRPERRQLTVLFCDLVGSTRISQRVDPEDLRALIRRFQHAAEPAIRRYDGFVSRFLGDGILAIFGYPHAHEDDPVHAIDAALDIVAAVAAIEWLDVEGRRHRLAVRIGVDTGLVVAGDLIGRDAATEEAVVGETPNLAARLQSIATPDAIIIGERTRRLLGGRFRLRNHGSHRLKGFEHEVAAWQVVAKRSPRSRFTARARRPPPLVDRHAELVQLRRAWETSCTGRTTILRMNGEAGVGKSRLAHELRDSLGGQPHLYLELQCSPYHRNTVLYPIAEGFQRRARIRASDTATVRRDKLATMLQRTGSDSELCLPPITALLSIPCPERERFEALDADTKKAATLDALCAHMASLTIERPVFTLLEDVQWADPTTLELTARFAREFAMSRLLIVLTARRDETLPLDLDTPLSVSLARLATDDTATLVEQLAHRVSLDSTLVQRIVERADGIALFAEELVEAIVERETHASGTPSDFDIPASLHDLLMARLDRLGPGRRVAQAASVIGREFDETLLDALLTRDGQTAGGGIDALIASGLVVADDDRRDRLRFKHALVRDTAYASLLREDRRQLHAWAFDTLERGAYPVAPELLARHAAGAEHTAQAERYWFAAGDAAAQRSAWREANEHFQKGLAIVRAQADEPARARRLLAYLVRLGPAAIAMHGAGSPEADAIYREAVALTEHAPNSDDHFTAVWGWWRISPDFHVSAARADRLAGMAERLDDDGLRLQAHHCRWAACFHLADHVGCRRHAEAGVALYALDDFRDHAARYGGHDARVCALGNLAQSLWLTGDPGGATMHIRRAARLADATQQLGSVVHALDMELMLLRYRGDAEAATATAHRLLERARAEQYEEYQLKARAFLAWAGVVSRREPRGLDLLADAIDTHLAIGTREDPPILLEMLAEACGRVGDRERGLEAIDRATALTAESGLGFWQPELLRRRGELLVADDPAAAALAFHSAARCARSQGAVRLELRALMGLSTLPRELTESERGDHADDGELSIGVDARLNALMRRFAVSPPPEHAADTLAHWERGLG